jgi:hypothetical protein
MEVFQEQLQDGSIQKAYRGLVDYIMTLKTYLKKRHPDYFVSGSLYVGYMDMTYFSFTPPSLKDRNLKIAIVFNYAAFRFEVWLGGYNKQVQEEYWKLFKKSGWKKYHLVPGIEGFDSIMEGILVENPDFDRSDELTKQIEEKTLLFINDVNDFLSGC